MFSPSCSPYVGSDKLKIVTTIFPPYDWVRVIAGDDADIELTLLLDSRVDLHSYQPTAADIIAKHGSAILSYTSVVHLMLGLRMFSLMQAII